MGRVCGECAAFVTTLGRTIGVFCDRGGVWDADEKRLVGACPYDRLGTEYRAAVGKPKEG